MKDDVVCNTVSIYVHMCCVYMESLPLFRHAVGQHKMCAHRFECVTDTSIVIKLIMSVKFYVMMYELSSCISLISCMVTFIDNFCCVTGT